MTAAQPIRYPAKSDQSLQRRRRRHRVLRSRPVLAPESHRVVAFETAAKLTFNLLLAAAAVSALVRLLPYRQAQAIKLQKIQGAVAVAEAEATELRQDFNRYFDPAQANHIMQEQSGRESPTQKTVVWVEPTY
ncbi:MAG: hypothetical protein AAF215_20260 [Cyanobacteria bacterium P01_A01_bin.123]